MTALGRVLQLFLDATWYCLCALLALGVAAQLITLVRATFAPATVLPSVREAYRMLGLPLLVTRTLVGGGLLAGVVFATREGAHSRLHLLWLLPACTATFNIFNRLIEWLATRTSS